MRKALFFWAVLSLVLAVSGWVRAAEPFVFDDVTDSSGIGTALKNWNMGHAGCWGDFNNSGAPSLYLGSFVDKAIKGQIPNMLFVNDGKGGFTISDDKAVHLDGLNACSTAAIFADLDNDGLMDLVVSNLRLAGSRSSTDHLLVLLKNMGNGHFQDMTPKDLPGATSGRNVAAYDFNGDGLLDLLVLDGNYNRAPGVHRVTVLENLGNWKFVDASAKYGMPDGSCKGSGLAIGDVNDDGVFDFFVADYNHLLVSGKDGKYHEVQRGLFVQPTVDKKGGAIATGATFGDINGDGLLDLVTTEHGMPSRIHVYLNKGNDADGMPTFEEVSDKVGMGMIIPGQSKAGLEVKGGHVQLLDMDNDGLLDIATAYVYTDSRGKPQPVVFKNMGLQSDGLPKFVGPPLDSYYGYAAPGPMADYDRDGKIDIFLVSWGSFLKASVKNNTIDIPSYLFHNVTPGGNWLLVKVTGEGRNNPMGIGAVVLAYKAGHAGDVKFLIQRHDIAIGTGFSSGEEALAHLGLGKAESVDLVIKWGKQTMTQANVPVNKFMTVRFEGK